jgi:hypothetical protein
MPFYDPSRAQSAYVEGAYAAIEDAMVGIRDFTRQRGAGLIVIALDNAFTVDPDVEERWIPPEAGLDLALPLRRLAGIAAAHGIRLLDARPALQRERRRLGDKIYLGREGEIAGHLTEAGERVIGEISAAELLGLWRHSQRSSLKESTIEARRIPTRSATSSRRVASKLALVDDRSPLASQPRSGKSASAAARMPALVSSARSPCTAPRATREIYLRAGRDEDAALGAGSGVGPVAEGLDARSGGRRGTGPGPAGRDTAP